MAIEKPEPRKRVKARRKRAEAKVVQAVRAKCVERDGYCRLAGGAARAVAGDCRGPSTWAHLAGHRRSQTRGRAPEDRHTTAGSLMLCAGHHEDEEQHRIRIEPTTPAGCDGTIKVTAPAGTYEETAA